MSQEGLIEAKAEKEKLAILYHGSPHRIEGDIDAAERERRKVEEGAAVFASPDRGFASVFMNDVFQSFFNGVDSKGKPYIIIRGAREKFLENDTGGVMYGFDPKDFEPDVSKGESKHEWVSKKPVEPISKLEYASRLEGMLQNRVNVYFVDDETYQKLLSAGEAGTDISSALAVLHQEEPPTSEK